MPQDKKISGTLVYSAITFLLLIIFIFPIPSILLDFFIAVNLVFSALIILDVYIVKIYKGFSSFPKNLLILIIFNFAINVIVTRYLLIFGEEFESMIIRFASSPIIGNIIAVFTACALFTACVIFYFTVINKMINKVSQIAIEYSADSVQVKMTAIDSDCDAGVITANEAEERKDSAKQKTNIFSELNKVCRYLWWYERSRFIFFIVNSAVGYFIGRNVRGEMMGDAFNTYITIAVSSGFLSLLSAALIAVSLGIVLKRFEHA